MKSYSRPTIYVGVTRFVTVLITLALLWPTMNTSLHADEVYGFIGLQGTGAWASPSYVITHPFSSELLHYFLTDQGRIAPFASLTYQGAYWLIAQIGILTNLNVPLVYGFFKLLLVVLIFISIRAWLRMMGESHGFANAKQWSIDVAIFAALVFAIGARVDSSFSNGLLTYSSITYTPALYSFALAVLVAKCLKKKSRGWIAFGLGFSATLAIVLAFSYELNAIPVGVTFLTLALLNKSVFPSARIAAAVHLISFGLAFAVSRHLIAQACKVNVCYTGTDISLSGRFLISVRNNILGVIPIKHSDIPRLHERGIGLLSLEPGIHSVIWWCIASVVAVVALLNLIRIRASSLGAPNRLFVSVAFVAFAMFLAACTATSMSIDAQYRLRYWTPYRGYPMSWTALALLLAIITIVVARSTSKIVSTRIVLVAISVVFGFMTIYLRPYSQMLMANEKIKFEQSSFSTILNELVDPNTDASANVERCAMVDALSHSRTGMTVRLNIEPAFQHFYNVPFCSATLLK